MAKTCAFSGHRNLNSGSFDNSLLDRVVLDLIKTGTTNFLCGMAVGFDLTAAQTVISYKQNYDVKLTACLPCADQKESFSAGNKIIYERVLEQCDEIITLSPEYRPGCMHGRNRYMVENCDILLCYLRKNSGGTFYTVNYARKLGKKIIEI